MKKNLALIIYYIKIYKKLETHFILYITIFNFKIFRLIILYIKIYKKFLEALHPHPILPPIQEILIFSLNTP